MDDARSTHLLRLLISPAMAFAVSFPTIGYYTAQTYTSLATIEGNGPAIAVRVVSIVVLLAAFLASAQYRSALPAQLTAGILFLIVYFFRILENVLLQGIVIMPSNEFVLLNYLFSLLLPALLLAALWRGFSASEAQSIFSMLSIAFAVGVVLLTSTESESVENSRLALEKVNPISLSYVCSSYLLFYLIAAQRIRRVAIEAALVSPVLLIVVAKAQSRGMMISTAACLAIYVALTRGTSRIGTITITGAIVLIATLTIDSKYLDLVFGALQRIDTLNDLSTATRVLSFQGAWHQFLADPLFGRYVSEIITGYYPHNIYLESLMAVGLLGTVPFVFHLFFATVAAVGVLRSKEVTWSWKLVALLYFRDAIGGAASGSIWGNNGLWITSFMLIAMWYGERRIRKQQWSAVRRPPHPAFVKRRSSSR